MFSVEDRISFIQSVVGESDNVKVMSYEGLTIDFCKNVNANFIVRGVRNNGDFEFEKAIARTNRLLDLPLSPENETILYYKYFQVGKILLHQRHRNHYNYKWLRPNKIH